MEQSNRLAVSVVIPVFNEEDAIAAVVDGLPKQAVDEIIVVDGGSRDATVERARAAGAKVIVERRRGYGRACASGAEAAVGDVIAFLDGDGADDPASLPLLLAPIVNDQADLALGARTRMEAGALPGHAVLGNKMAAWLISVVWRQRITDLPSFKALRRDRLLALNMTEDTYGWTIEMVVKAARSGFRITEIPLDYHRRAGGESKVSGNVTTSLKAAGSILSTLARHAFSPSGGGARP